MIFPVAIVPDLPGCFSAGDTLDEAEKCAHEAAAAWLDAALDADLTIPAPSRPDAVRSMPDNTGWVFGVIDVEAGCPIVAEPGIALYNGRLEVIVSCL